MIYDPHPLRQAKGGSAVIHITQHGWEWPELDSPTKCPEPQVWYTPAERVSELLGPDGEPLLVPYPRRRIGFDLTPKGEAL